MKIKITIHPDYEYLREFIEELPGIFSSQGQILQDGRNTIKIFEANGIILNVKRFRIPIFINRVAYTFFRGNKASKAYYNSIEVNKRGFTTPSSVAFIEEFSSGLLSYSYYISLQCPYSKEIREYHKGPLQGNEAFFTAFAQYSASLHNAEIYHLDYSPGNILINEDNNHFEFCLVDINRMIFKPVSLKSGCQNFERLFNNDEVYIFLATEYAKARGMDVAECIKWINYYKDRFLKKDLRKDLKEERKKQKRLSS